MSTSRLQQTINQFRSQLNNHEAIAERTLNTAYRSTLETINPELNILYRAMQNKILLGQRIPVEWIYENRRLQTIKALIERQIGNYGTLTRAQVAELQRSGVALGDQAGHALLQATVPSGVSYAFGIPDQRALHALVGANQPGSPLYDLFNTFGSQAADEVGKVLLTGLTLGWNPRDVEKSVSDALDIPRARALTIARTEMLRAYRGAAMENYRANSDVVSQWRWTCAKSARTCAACIAMDGTLHDVDQEMQSHPNCRCAPLPVTKSWEDILGPLGIDTSTIPETTIDIPSGSDWFDKQPEKIQRQILGNAKYEAWKNNQFTLHDIVGHTHDAEWGNAIYERSLKETLAKASPVEEAPAPVAAKTDVERVQEIEDRMNAKYPETVFDLAGAHPDLIAPAMAQLDTLFEQYPEVGRSIPYVGTGENAPKGYGPETVSKELLSNGIAWTRASSGSSSRAYVPMTLNPKYFSNPELMDGALAEMERVGWTAAGSGSIDYIMSHEFGHVAKFFLEQNGRDQAFVGWEDGEEDVRNTLLDFLRDNARGANVSQYADTNRDELFAESFASARHAKPADQVTFVRDLGKLLDKLLPGGSSAGWEYLGF